MNWENHPLLRLGLPFVLGMAGASLLMPSTATNDALGAWSRATGRWLGGLSQVSVLFILCCVGLVLLFFLLDRQPCTHRGPGFALVAMPLFFLIGMTLYTRQCHHLRQGIPADTTFCQGILADEPQEKSHTWALTLRQTNGTHIIIYIGKDSRQPRRDSVTFAALQVGDTIVARTRHLQATGHGTGDFQFYRDHLFRHGICATAYTPAAQWAVRPRQGRPALLGQAKALQTRLHHIYDDRGINGEAGSIVEAMTIGRKATLPKDTRSAYAASGVSHVLALSGFHVGIVVLLLQTLLLHRLTPHRWQWLGNLLTLLALWAFAAVVGFSPSLTRATLMCTILLLCQTFSHDLLSLQSCTLALLIMLCINPLQLHDVGFQLSFAAVAGICLCVPLLPSSHATRSGILRFLLDLILITLVCTIATTPLAAHHFGRVPLLGLLANLLITPLVYLIMYASLLWWLFLWCAPAHSLLNALLLWTADSMNALTAHISSLPLATIPWHPNAPTTLLCYAALLTLVFFITTKKTEKLK